MPCEALADPVVSQGFAFLDQYRRLRGPCPETEYNLARAFHHLGTRDVEPPDDPSCAHSHPLLQASNLTPSSTTRQRLT